MNWIDRLKAFFRLQGIIAHYRRSGSGTPVTAALEEVRFRGYIEQCRDYMSDRYVRERTEVSKAKKDWLDDNIPTIHAVFGAAKAKALRSAINAMPVYEALHPHALRKWDDDGKQMVAEAPDILAGLSEQERRVLTR